MRDFAFHSMFVPLMVLGFYSSHIAILIWIWISLLPPADMLYGTFGVLPFNKLVVAITVFTLFTRQEKNDFYIDKLMILVILYAIIVTLSYFLSEHDNSFADLQYDKFWKELVLFFLITGVIRSQHRLYQAAIVFSAGFGFLMVKEALIFLLTAGGHKVGGMGVVGDNNGVALALLMTIPIVIYCGRFALQRSIKLAFYITAVLGTITVIATYSRGGFVGLIALGLMLLKGSKYKVRALLLVLAISLTLYSLVPDSYLTRMDTISSAADDDSFAIRLLAWKINTLLAIDHPILGVGLYGSVDYKNWISEMPIARDWLFDSPLVLRSFVAHSIYFQALGDTGFTGATLFISILLVSIFKLKRTERLVQGNPDFIWLGDFARALKMSIIVYMISGAALSLLYFEPLYIILALASRVHRLAGKPDLQKVAYRYAQRSCSATTPNRKVIQPTPVGLNRKTKL